MNKGVLLRKIRWRMQVLASVGILLSCYALYVEVQKGRDTRYEAMCDINNYISCSKVFTSEYGRGFGIVSKYLGEDHVLNQPNSVPGIMFYILVLGFSKTRSPSLASFLFCLVFMSNFMSMYLAYVLYYILHDFCVICVTTYIINLLLTLSGYQLICAFKIQPQKKKKH